MVSAGPCLLLLPWYRSLSRREGDVTDGPAAAAGLPSSHELTTQSLLFMAVARAETEGKGGTMDAKLLSYGNWLCCRKRGSGALVWSAGGLLGRTVTTVGGRSSTASSSSAQLSSWSSCLAEHLGVSTL